MEMKQEWPGSRRHPRARAGWVLQREAKLKVDLTMSSLCQPSLTGHRAWKHGRRQYSPWMWRAVTRVVKFSALATGQPSGLAIIHRLPLPLPAARSPPCQTALKPLSSSCQQMFARGVAGRQLSRTCILLAPEPLREPSLCRLCKHSGSLLPCKPQYPLCLAPGEGGHHGCLIFSRRLEDGSSSFSCSRLLGWGLSY